MEPDDVTLRSFIDVIHDWRVRSRDVALNETIRNAVFVWSVEMCFIFCRANKRHIYIYATPLQSSYRVGF